MLNHINVFLLKRSKKEIILIATILHDQNNAKNKDRVRLFF